MDITAQHGYNETPAEERKTKALAGGTMTESILGAFAIVLVIIGLAGAAPGIMASLATIIVGVALMLEGAALAARFTRAVSDIGRNTVNITDLGGGITTELIGGATGIVLGIIAFFGAATFEVVAAAAIVMGAALAIGSGVTARVNSLIISSRTDNERLRDLSRQVLMGASGVRLLSGIAAIILGIIALTGLAPISLDLVAMLVLSAAVFMSGSGFSGTVMSVFRR